MDPTKDTPAPAAAPSATPASQTPTGTTEATESAPVTTQGTTEKVYAGKFKSVEDLESAYKNSETKIGQKGYAEKIGQKVVEATGYSVADLESAGYSPEQIAQAVTSYAKTGEQAVPQATPTATIKQTVEDSRVTNLEYELKLRDFFAEHPEAKEFKDDIKEFHSLPQYRDMSPEDIFANKLKRFMTKGQEAALQRQTEKERAGMAISNTPAPEPDTSKDSLKRFNKSHRLDDAADFVMAKLFKKKG